MPYYAIFLLALALGIDTFPIAVLLGGNGIRLKKVAQLSLAIGLVQTAMPLIGAFLGRLLDPSMGEFADVVIGCVLVGLGLESFDKSLTSSREKIPRKGLMQSMNGFQFAGLALGLGLEDAIAGVSVGLINARTAIAIALIIGITATAISGTGLMLGRSFRRLGEKQAEAVSAYILIGLGMLFVLGGI